MTLGARAARRLQDASRRKPAATPFGSQPIGIPPARDGLLARIQPGAIGSLLVLAGLIGVLGYGGYAVLSEVQKVRLVPVEEAPEVVAEYSEAFAPALKPVAEELDAMGKPGTEVLERIRAAYAE